MFVGVAILGVNWSCPVAGRALPYDWLYIVPPTLTLHTRMHGTVFAYAVIAGRATRSPYRRSLRLSWRVVGARACVCDRESARPRVATTPISRRRQGINPNIPNGSGPEGLDRQRSRIHVESTLLFQGDNAVHNSVTDSRWIVLQLLELFPSRVGVAVLPVTLHFS